MHHVMVEQQMTYRFVMMKEERSMTSQSMYLRKIKFTSFVRKDSDAVHIFTRKGHNYSANACSRLCNFTKGRIVLLRGCDAACRGLSFGQEGILNGYAKTPSKPKVFIQSAQFQELEAVPTAAIVEWSLEHASAPAAIPHVTEEALEHFFNAGM